MSFNAELAAGSLSEARSGRSLQCWSPVLYHQNVAPELESGELSVPILSTHTKAHHGAKAKATFDCAAPSSRFAGALGLVGNRGICQAKPLLFGFLCSLVIASPVEAQNNWTYQGRTVTITVGAPAGGGYDYAGRLLARHLSRHLPGNPSVIVKNMPGAGGLTLASYLQTTALRDGTEFGEFEHGTAFAPLLTKARTSFDPLTLGWLGSMEQFTPIAAVWHTVPVYSFEDLLKTSINVGTSGAGSTTAGYPYSLNAILGTQMKVIGGYKGTPDYNLAIERGELDGLASWCWTCAKAQKPDWIANKKLRVIMQLAENGDPELTKMGIPTVFEKASTGAQRQMLGVVFRSVMMSRPFAAPPGVPAERLAMLRAAFEAAVKDTALIGEAAKTGMDVEFISSARIENLLKDTFATDPALIEKVRNAYSGQY
jgi:tripartite-type tricarboxylate transporter receptor subunit TctC